MSCICSVWTATAGHQVYPQSVKHRTTGTSVYSTRSSKILTNANCHPGGLVLQSKATSSDYYYVLNLWTLWSICFLFDVKLIVFSRHDQCKSCLVVAYLYSNAAWFKNHHSWLQMLYTLSCDINNRELFIRRARTIALQFVFCHEMVLGQFWVTSVSLETSTLDSWRRLILRLAKIINSMSVLLIGIECNFFILLKHSC